jgi:2-polyprenyl-3-methyl-5-hydroxy-6-metoxy-1,4-benzoquinol methylase
MNRSLLARIATRAPATPAHTLLSAVRTRAREHALQAHAHEGLNGRELSVTAERALTDMRAEVDRADGTPLGVLTRFDKWWRTTDAREWMDDVDIDASKRTRIADALDQLNQAVGTYDAIHGVLSPLLADGISVVELCAGHGGFSRALARQARDEGLALRITATDLHEDYLDLGRKRAQREQLSVAFRQQNALDLSALASDPPDVIVCAQALHHFEPGSIARMFAEATRLARRGVVFFDGCRSALLVPVIAVLGAVLTRNVGVVHDGAVSCRRFLAKEELDLLCSLAAPRGHLETMWLPPAHVAVRWQP